MQNNEEDGGAEAEEPAEAAPAFAPKKQMRSENPEFQNQQQERWVLLHSSGAHWHSKALMSLMGRTCINQADAQRHCQVSYTHSKGIKFINIVGSGELELSPGCCAWAQQPTDLDAMQAAEEAATERAPAAAERGDAAAGAGS